MVYCGLASKPLTPPKRLFVPVFPCSSYMFWHDVCDNTKLSEDCWVQSCSQPAGCRLGRCVCVLWGSYLEEDPVLLLRTSHNTHVATHDSVRRFSWSCLWKLAEEVKNAPDVSTCAALTFEPISDRGGQSLKITSGCSKVVFLVNSCCGFFYCARFKIVAFF